MQLVKKLKDAVALRSLSSVARTVRNERITYLSIEKLRRLEITLAAFKPGQVDGDFLEFGVALGGASIVIATAAMR